MTHLEIAYCKKIDNFDFLRKYKNALKNYAFYNCGVSVGNDVSILNEVFSGKEFWLSGGDLTTVQSILNRLYDPFEEIVPNSSYVFCTGDQYINEYYLTQYEKCTELEKIVIKCRNNTNYFNGTNDTLNLKDLKVLKKLYLDGVSIENIDVQGATNLEKVAIIDNLRGNYWKPCDFSKNNKLIYLDLSKNKLENSDLENLVNNIKPEYSGGDLVSGCPLLEELHLNNNNFSTIASIENLTIVKKLDVSNNMLINLNGIENLTQLTELNISNNPGITNITPILTLKNKDGNNLSKVTLTGCNGISLEAKESLKQTGITVVEN